MLEGARLALLLPSSGHLLGLFLLPLPLSLLIILFLLLGHPRANETERKERAEDVLCYALPWLLPRI